MRRRGLPIPSRVCPADVVASAVHENINSVFKWLLLTTDGWGSFLKGSQRQGAARSGGGGSGLGSSKTTGKRLLLGRGHAIFGAAQAAHSHGEVVLAPGRRKRYVRMSGRK